VLSRSGTGCAFLNDYGTKHADYVVQHVTIPAAGSAALTFYADIETEERGTGAPDTLQVQVRPAGETSYTTVKTFSNRDAGGGYRLRSVNLSGFTGRTVDLRFYGHEDSARATGFLLDDLTLSAS
jgi:hypothetical protein